MKLMVCGSRSITDTDWIYRQIDACVSENHFEDIIIIEGDAQGVDKAAGLWAEQHGYQIKKHPADWNKYGRGAGFVRNKEMVESCDFCLILWDGKSKGTKHDLELCQKLEKPFKLVRNDIWR